MIARKLRIYLSDYTRIPALKQSYHSRREVSSDGINTI